MIAMMAHARRGQPFNSPEAKGEYLEVDPDTVDAGNQFFAKAHGVNGGEEWRLWSAPDTRPVEERVIFGQKTSAGWQPVCSVTLL